MLVNRDDQPPNTRDQLFHDCVCCGTWRNVLSMLGACMNRVDEAPGVTRECVLWSGRCMSIVICFVSNLYLLIVTEFQYSLLILFRHNNNDVIFFGKFYGKKSKENIASDFCPSSPVHLRFAFPWAWPVPSSLR